MVKLVLGKNWSQVQFLLEAQSSVCYNCSVYTGQEKRDYDRIWRAKRRTNFFTGKSCVECGSKEKLELDHIDPAEKITHNIWSWSKVRRDLEIAKCQILCQKCHKEKTKLWNFQRRKHGLTWYGYGCRCEICFVAQQKHNARRNMPG